MIGWILKGSDIKMAEDSKSDQFYHDEDMAAATIGRDDAPEESPDKARRRLRQRQSDRDFEDKETRIEIETERLFQLARQEGLIEEEGSKSRYGDVGELIQTGRVSNDEAFQEKLAEIQKRDETGEWAKSFVIGQEIPKAGGKES